MSNNKVLIDSHVLIWLLYEPEKISSEAKSLIQSADVVYTSTISLWELTLKFSKGKLAYPPKQLFEGVQALNLEMLQLSNEHILSILDIELPHKDPFDSILIAQSVVEGCIFLSADSLILASKYHTFRC